ncbi:hypothetical protein O7627_12455 [Solwaraspora sp. WMMD1047]|uniref:hypothetical protein n=1 Tax=Solwaraspora sp. WMMD1047 TaxID=3016102 RepID=UPI0024175356|nr:hypothetical protein [Solwaraspora sp. WMMD1047]MDG4830109.1 hypothetical protein [Solwaraspora sp. WMMD1047]
MASGHAGDPGDVSLRLIQILRIYGGGLSSHTLGDLREVVRAGRYPWLRDEFGSAIRTGAFTAASWSSAIGLEPPIDLAERTVHDQQRLVWAAIFGDEPFPAAGRSVAR